LEQRHCRQKTRAKDVEIVVSADTLDPTSPPCTWRQHSTLSVEYIMPFTLLRASGAMKCPKCKTPSTYGDVFINSPPEGQRMTIGSATRVVLDPCGCSATSGDAEFLDMLQIVELIADPNNVGKNNRMAN
jgi:hypothetical protein